MQVESPSCRQCERFCGNARLYPTVARKLTSGVQRLKISSKESLLKKYLTDKTYYSLKRIKTKAKSNLLDCIQSGIENLDSSPGIYAPDPECYKTFAPLFNPIISEIHNFDSDSYHPEDDWGNPKKIKNLDKKVITSVTITCNRCLEAYPFPLKLTKEEFMEFRDTLEEEFCTILQPADLRAGIFFAYDEIPQDVLNTLEKANAMFKPNSRFLEAADNYNYWPEGRGVFINKKKNLFVWFNEEDHLKFISYNKGPKLKDVYGALYRSVQAIGKIFPFLRDERLGYLSVNPAFLGTTLKFVIVAKCPALIQSREVLDDIIEKYDLDADIPEYPPETKIPKNASVTFRSKAMLGVTEFELAKHMQGAMTEVAKKQKSEEKRLKKLAKGG